MINAWATANRLVLGQRKVDKKSNEIKAIPELIKILDVSGCIVTIDAMGCQKEIVKLITQKQGDYIITLKKNQKNLYKNVEELFRESRSGGNAFLGWTLLLNVVIWTHLPDKNFTPVIIKFCLVW